MSSVTLGGPRFSPHIVVVRWVSAALQFGAKRALVKKPWPWTQPGYARYLTGNGMLGGIDAPTRELLISEIREPASPNVTQSNT